MERQKLISIKRTIGAKKDEYFVNQRHTDKQELNNLLESAGISKFNQHFIVPQGQIAQRVKERDNERLKLIKEIAGTRIYDERRNESMKLMSNADNKRKKVEMVINYFEDRLNENEKRGNKNGYFVGDSVSIADLKGFFSLKSLSAGIYDGIPTDVLKKYTKISNLVDKMSKDKKYVSFDELFKKNVELYKKDSKNNQAKYN